MDKLNLFIPITKVDAAQRLVYGVATGEVEDRSKEVCDYATTKPFYEKWSGEIHKSSGGKSMGNLRAMHGKVAAGKVTALSFNDEAKQIEICAKVVDDGEWNKVIEGVYTGFSQGGAYVKRWKDDAGLQRYTADPSEISLVDLPCLPTATFEMIKADGAHEQRPFKAVDGPVISNDQIAAVAGAMAKAAGDETKWADYIEPARVELTRQAGEATSPVAKAEHSAVEVAGKTPIVGDEWEQVWKSKRDGTSFKTKAELRKYHEQLDADAAVKVVAHPALDVLKNINEALAKKDYSDEDREKMASEGTAMKDGSYPIATKADIDNAVQAFGRAKNKTSVKRHITQRAKALDATDALPADWPGSTKGADKSATAGALKKDASLYGVANLLQLLASLGAAEDALESNGAGYSPFCCYPEYGGNTGPRVQVDKELTTRFGTLVGQLGDIVTEVLDAVLGSMKDGEASEAMAAAAPIIDLMKLGARNSKSDKERIQKAHDALVEAGATCGGADKAQAAAGLSKAADEALAKATAERDVLQKALDLVKPHLDEILKKVTNIENQPAPHPLYRIAEKQEDSASGTAQKNLSSLLESDQGRDALALAAIKLAQTSGQPVYKR